MIEDPEDCLKDPTSLLTRMKRATRVIRVVESGDLPCIDMCMLQLSHDNHSVHILEECMKTHSIDCMSIAEVARSNVDEHAIALLIPSTSEIVQFIFGSEEECNRWFTGLRSLCSGDLCSSRVSTPDTAHSEAGCDENEGINRERLPYHDTICDLIELISELRDQNDELVRARGQYEEATFLLASELERSQAKLFSVMEENKRLQSCLNSRDSGLLNMAELLISILKTSGSHEYGESRRASLESVETNIRPHDCIAHCE